MSQKVFPFLMFNGQAEEAMKLYGEAFNGVEILNVVRSGEKVMHAVFSLKGEQVMCIDNLAGDSHAFTPAMSVFVKCDDEAEVDRAFEKLSANGKVLMAPGPLLPFARKFAWVADRFGVNWQLSLEK